MYIDELSQPWDGILPVEEFSVKFKVADLPRLPQLINEISDEEISNLQSGVRRYQSRYHYASIFGVAHSESHPNALDQLVLVLDQRIHTKHTVF